MSLPRCGFLLVVFATSACATRASEVSSVPPPSAPAGPVVVSGSRENVIPVGQEIDVRLQETLSSGTATVENRFRATTAVDLMQDGRVLVPSGSVVQGVVSGVDPATRTDRTGSLRLSFTQLSVRGREYPIIAKAVRVFESEGLRGETENRDGSGRRSHHWWHPGWSPRRGGRRTDRGRRCGRRDRRQGRGAARRRDRAHPHRRAGDASRMTCGVHSAECGSTCKVRSAVRSACCEQHGRGATQFVALQSVS